MTRFTGVHNGQAHTSALQATNSGAVQDNHLVTLDAVEGSLTFA